MTEPYSIICRFLLELVGMISLDRNYRSKFTICCCLGYTWIYLEVRECCNFGTKNWHVVSAQEVKDRPGSLVIFERKQRKKFTRTVENRRSSFTRASSSKLILIRLTFSHLGNTPANWCPFEWISKLAEARSYFKIFSDTCNYQNGRKTASL